MAESGWHWSLNWDEITPTILIGSCPMSVEDIDRIRDGTGVTAVLSLQHDACLAAFQIDYPSHVQRGVALGLVLERCPILDFDAGEMRRHLPHAVRRLALLLGEGHRAYVHCTAGIGRSALVVLGYLTFVAGLPPGAALEVIRAKRSCVSPNLEAYDECRNDLLERYGQRIADRVEDFSRRGAHDEAVQDWRRAEAEVLRDALLGGFGDAL